MELSHLKEWCKEHLWALGCYHGFMGNGWDVVVKYILAHNTYEHNLYFNQSKDLPRAGLH